MRKKTVKELINDPEMLNRAKDGVTFSNDDRQFLERQYDGLLEYLKTQLTENQKFLATILIDTNANIEDKMDALMEAMLEIKRDVKELRIEIKEIKSEVKELKIDIKGINLDLLVIHKQLMEHHIRIEKLEGK